MSDNPGLIFTPAVKVMPSRDWKRAIVRGLRLRCPACGDGHLFERFLKVAPVCERCGEQLHHHRADDAPPYFAVLLVGHIVVPLVFIVERLWRPDLWVHFALWLPLTLVLTLLLLPPIKGGIVGLQWALFMHGFEVAAKTCRPRNSPVADVSR